MHLEMGISVPDFVFYWLNHVRRLTECLFCMIFGPILLLAMKVLDDQISYVSVALFPFYLIIF